MTYINFVELQSLMFHTKFLNSLAFWFWRRRFLKVFSIYSHGGHLGHVNLTKLTIYINFLSPFPRMLHMKFGFDWPCGFRGEDVSLLWKYMYIAPGQGQTTPQGLKFSININHLSICLFPVSFTH